MNFWIILNPVYNAQTITGTLSTQGRYVLPSRTTDRLTAVYVRCGHWSRLDMASDISSTPTTFRLSSTTDWYLHGVTACGKFKQTPIHWKVGTALMRSSTLAWSFDG